MKHNKVPLILFVCTGNQIRSPIAAAIFERHLAESGMKDSLRVESAGTWTVPGRFDSRARLAARRMGLEIDDHRSRSIERDILLEAKLVIVMEQGHKEALEIEYPQVRGNIELLSQLAGEQPYNIPDPSGSDIDNYIEIGEELLRLVNSAFDSIIRFVQER
jgi:protein-tyrosine phosphatase